MITIPLYDEFGENASQVQRQLDRAARVLDEAEFQQLRRFAEGHAQRRNFPRSAANAKTHGTNV